MLYRLKETLHVGREKTHKYENFITLLASTFFYKSASQNYYKLHFFFNLLFSSHPTVQKQCVCERWENKLKIEQQKTKLDPLKPKMKNRLREKFHFQPMTLHKFHPKIKLSHDLPSGHSKCTQVSLIPSSLNMWKRKSDLRATG